MELPIFATSVGGCEIVSSFSLLGGFGEEVNEANGLVENGLLKEEYGFTIDDENESASASHITSRRRLRRHSPYLNLSAVGVDSPIGATALPPIFLDPPRNKNTVNSSTRPNCKNYDIDAVTRKFQKLRNSTNSRGWFLQDNHNTLPTHHFKPFDDSWKLNAIVPPHSTKTSLLSPTDDQSTYMEMGRTIRKTPTQDESFYVPPSNEHYPVFLKRAPLQTVQERSARRLSDDSARTSVNEKVEATLQKKTPHFVYSDGSWKFCVLVPPPSRSRRSNRSPDATRRAVVQNTLSLSSLARSARSHVNERVEVTFRRGCLKKTSQFENGATNNTRAQQRKKSVSWSTTESASPSCLGKQVKEGQAEPHSGIVDLLSSDSVDENAARSRLDYGKRALSQPNQQQQQSFVNVTSRRGNNSRTALATEHGGKVEGNGLRNLESSHRMIPPSLDFPKRKVYQLPLCCGYVKRHSSLSSKENVTSSGLKLKPTSTLKSDMRRRGNRELDVWFAQEAE